MGTVSSILLATALGVTLLVARARIRALRDEVAQLQSAQEELENRLSQDQKDSALRQETLFNHMLEGVLILDGEGKVSLLNSAMRTLVKVSGKVEGKRLIEAIRSHELYEIVSEAEEKGHVTGRDLVVTSGIEQQYFGVNASSYKDSENMAGVIVILHDLTTLKQLESGRREFVANVSHELRTPLSMIKGYVETLLGGGVTDPELESRFLGKIQKHSDRLTYLIEDLLALSQLESNQIALSIAEVPISKLINRVVADVQEKAAVNGVELTAKVDESLTLSVDADRVLQVLQNLIDNGIKYGGKEGNEGKVVVQALAGEGDTVVVSVADDGPGIPLESRERVFERFFRVDKARSREQGGTGLGLAIVKHIVQSHGGRVWLEQAEPTGAIFSFTLPTVSKADRSLAS